MAPLQVQMLGETHPGAFGIQNPFLWAPLEVWASRAGGVDGVRCGCGPWSLFTKSGCSCSSSGLCAVAAMVDGVVGPWSVDYRWVIIDIVSMEAPLYLVQAVALEALVRALGVETSRCEGVSLVLLLPQWDGVAIVG